ncbi:MAG: hypothetical protein AAF589_00660 [Planctomycetota bacterium]
MNKYVVPLLALSALLLVQVVDGQNNDKAKPTTPIHVAELASKPVIGMLNVPLGSIVTIEGRYEIRQDDPLTKGNESAVLLNVTSVDGKKAGKDMIVFQFPPGKLLNAISPRNGENFKLIAYEAGSFDGDVRGAQQYEVVVAKAFRPFKFRTYLNILKDDLKGMSQSDAFFRK